ncbi:hypothetical protein PIB30_070111, partial [Stylosanthes scabra]|nr:hypothetical protein [Stylosanthes scabra]
MTLLAREGRVVLAASRSRRQQLYAVKGRTKGRWRRRLLGKEKPRSLPLEHELDWTATP